MKEVTLFTKYSRIWGVNLQKESSQVNIDEVHESNVTVEINNSQVEIMTLMQRQIRKVVYTFVYVSVQPYYTVSVHYFYSEQTFSDANFRYFLMSTVIREIDNLIIKVKCMHCIFCKNLENHAQKPWNNPSPVSQTVVPTLQSTLLMHVWMENLWKKMFRPLTPLSFVGTTLLKVSLRAISPLSLAILPTSYE